jgi:hypothetical protein
MNELPLPVPLADQIACVEREIMLREGTYPRWIKGNRMRQDRADIEIARMKAVLATLKQLAEDRR